MSDTIISVENLASCPEGDTARRGKRYSDVDWVVYAIANGTGRVYIGQTGNFERRLKAHNAGHVRSTRNGRPWKLVAEQKCSSQSAARWLEFRLKQSRGSRLRWLQKRQMAR